MVTSAVPLRLMRVASAIREHEAMLVLAGREVNFDVGMARVAGPRTADGTNCVLAVVPRVAAMRDVTARF